MPKSEPVHGMSTKSSTTDPAIERIQVRYKEDIIKNHSKLVKQGSPPVHQVKVKQVYSSEADNVRKTEFGTEVKKGVPEKVLMVVGATGSGKSTVLNGLFNYIVGVKWSDPFRFRLVDEVEQVKGKTQAESQTSWITSYTIKQHNGSLIPFDLTIIDTPGFGDTRGIKRDRQITEQIRKFFSSIGDFGIDHIDAVGFVVQAALSRLTHTQKYIFDSVLSLFGKDIAGNIFLFLTFADSQKPAALAAVEVAKIPYQTHFKFNNSAMFISTQTSDSDDEDENFDEMFWKMSNRSYKKFLFFHLEITEGKSLVLTKTVLEKRSQLETFMNGINADIQKGLLKCEEVTKELKVMQEHQKDIESNKDFNYIVKEGSWQKIDIFSLKAVNCTICETTCHFPCGHLMVMSCSAISWLRCTSCGCNASKHRQSNQMYKFLYRSVVKTKKDMLEKYKDAEGKKMSAKEMKEKAGKELEEIQKKLVFLTDSATRALEELNKIALKPNPLSTCDYIDLMIETEKSEGKEGWKDRLEQLIEVRKHAEDMQKLVNDGMDPFAEYMKELDGIGDKDMDDPRVPPEEKKDRQRLTRLFSFRLKFTGPKHSCSASE